jgi:NADPH:quinone reductase-like Zn-dependent oxidoreductase
VSACAVNPVDYKIRKGLVGAPHTYPLILGYDISGVVEAMGEKVADIKEGDLVYYFPPINMPGGYAEYHVVDHRLVVPKPRNISHAEAASIPLVGLTVWEALFDRGEIKIGESILVHGGAGGTGSMAIQLAHWSGLKVTTTASKENEAFVRNLGADDVIDYQQNDFVEAISDLTNGRGVNVVLDTVGGEVLERSFEAVALNGRVVSIVETQEPLSLMPLFMRNASFHYEFMALGLNYGEGLEHKRTILFHLSNLIERNAIHPVVQKTLTLEEAPEAHRLLESRHTRGKIVLAIE